MSVEEAAGDRAIAATSAAPTVASAGGSAVGSPVGSAVGPAVDVAGIPDAELRSALDFAVGIAAAGQKLRPPLTFPVGLKPYLKLNRLDRMALHAVRRALVNDVEFRDRIAGVATDELVDELGLAWLRRGVGWEDRVRTLYTASKAAAEDASLEVALRKADRRREAAEQVAARANAELIGHNDSLAREQMRREKAEQAAGAAAAEAASLRNEITGLRRELDKVRQRADAQNTRADAAERAKAEAQERLRVAEALRDEVLSRRAAEPMVTVAAPTPTPPDSAAAGAAASNRTAARALQQAAAATRDLAGALATAAEALSSVTVPAAPAAGRAVTHTRTARSARVPQRKPIAIPGGVYGDSLAAANHLLRTPNAVVIVDGYNVAKLAWPSFELSDQREMCIDLLEDVVRRLGAIVRVVFDGADVIGASSGRRLIRVQFSPAGVSADDVVRAEVQSLPATTPVVVVTNDQAIVNDVRSDGANVVSSDMLLAVAGRLPSR